MSKKNHYLSNILVCTVAFAALFLASCSKPAPKEQNEPDSVHDKIIVGFSQIGAESAWRIFNSKSMQIAADKNITQIMIFFTHTQSISYNKKAGKRDGLSGRGKNGTVFR